VRRLGSLTRVTDGADARRARQRLEAEQGRVEGLIQSVRGDFGDGSENDDTSELAHYDQHPADMGSETFEREKDLSILEQLEAELAEIQAALRRIDEGTYGIDEVTGEPIPPERLDAVPTARTNVHGIRANDSRSKNN
jgi:RNA polymerase-binding transcription factor DksA